MNILILKLQIGKQLYPDEILEFIKQENLTFEPRLVSDTEDYQYYRYFLKKVGKFLYNKQELIFHENAKDEMIETLCWLENEKDIFVEDIKNVRTFYSRLFVEKTVFAYEKRNPCLTSINSLLEEYCYLEYPEKQPETSFEQLCEKLFK